MRKLLPKFVICGALTGISATAFAQNNDPFAGGGEEAPVKQAGRMLNIVYEVFSLPLTKAAELQRARITDSEFYGKLLGGLKDKSVKQETFLVARTLSGNKAQVDETTEYIYPTEFDPPELPNMVAGQHLKADHEGKMKRIFPVTPANPTAYETRPLGETLEVEAVLANGVVEIRLMPSRVTLIQKDTSGQGHAKIVMPRFANPRIQTGLTTRSGKPSYLGTVSAPQELQPKDGEQRVFFAFVTATHMK